MTRALARLGDKTTSGGYVLSASLTIIEERNIALSGDKALCPKETCNGVFAICGTAVHFVENQPCVATGDRVLCNCKNNQVLGSTTIWVEDSPSDPSGDAAKRAASWPINNRPPVIPAVIVLVFAKSVLRGTGNTDAGIAEEPQDNIGEMSFYQSRPSQPVPEPEQHAQAAKKKIPPHHQRKNHRLIKLQVFSSVRLKQCLFLCHL
ncbi:PAAR domain-containing protein [Yersinia enterocolitica]|uniref:PAAR domain-containing protein n=1 Tax=Yersinia ruckeri TaxID=29486 RepID=UPI0038BACBBA